MAGAAVLAERCRRQIENVQLAVKNEILQTTASFGVAEAVGLPSAEALVAQADEALYRAKGQGRNAVEHAAPCHR